MFYVLNMERDLSRYEYFKCKAYNNINDGINWMYCYYPVFKYLKDIVDHYTGIKVELVDMLFQSSLEIIATKEAFFGWYTYAKPEHQHILRSLYFLLNSSKTTMQMRPRDHP